MSLLHATAPYRRGDAGSARVPVVLPLVQVRVSDGGLLDVTIDHSAYGSGRPLARQDLHRILGEITRELASPVKVEIHEPDDTVFTDIIAPTPQLDVHDELPTSPAGRVNVSSSPGEVVGGGFLPHEEVAVAVVVAYQSADAEGTARLRLPPALLAGRPGAVVLLGSSSGAVTLSGPTGSAR